MTDACGPQLFDMHCHLGFFPDPVRLAEALAAKGVGCWSMTVTPREYDEQRLRFDRMLPGFAEAPSGSTRPRLGEVDLDTGFSGPGSASVRAEGVLPKRTTGHERVVPPAPSCLPGNVSGSPAPLLFVRLAAGLHPWWVERGLVEAQAQAEALAALVSVTPFVGEVGLDFARRGIAVPEVQEAAFRAIVAECVRSGGRAVSIHAVGKGAAGRVLDILEDARFFADGSNCAVFHWFSGSSDELVRARDLGCRFSVGLPMLRAKRGQSYAAQIPEAQLLLETDLPQRPEASVSTADGEGASLGEPEKLPAAVPRSAEGAGTGIATVRNEGETRPASSEPGEEKGKAGARQAFSPEALADAMERQLTETLEMLAAVRNDEPGRLADALRCSSLQILDRR